MSCSFFIEFLRVCLDLAAVSLSSFRALCMARFSSRVSLYRFFTLANSASAFAKLPRQSRHFVRLALKILSDLRKFGNPRVSGHEVLFQSSDRFRRLSYSILTLQVWSCTNTYHTQPKKRSMNLYGIINPAYRSFITARILHTQRTNQYIYTASPNQFNPTPFPFSPPRISILPN